MLPRNAFLAAGLTAFLAWSPASASAQERGTDRAAVATAHAEEVAGWEHGQAQNRPSEAPSGVSKHFEGRTPPPGINRNWPAPEPEPASEPEPDGSTGGTTCEPQIVLVDGQLMLQECDGTTTPILGSM